MTECHHAGGGSAVEAGKLAEPGDGPGHRLVRHLQRLRDRRVAQPKAMQVLGVMRDTEVGGLDFDVDDVYSERNMTDSSRPLRSGPPGLYNYLIALPLSDVFRVIGSQ